MKKLMDSPSVSPPELIQHMEDWRHGDDAALAIDSNKSCAIHDRHCVSD